MNITALIVMLFPSFSNFFQHACSGFVITLTLMGLPLCRFLLKRGTTSVNEKMVMGAFASYILVSLFSFAANSILGDPEILTTSFVGHQLRMLAILPVVLLFRKKKLPIVVLWYSITAGAVASGIYAVLSGVIFHPGERVSGSYHAIAFGDISLCLAFMSLAGISFFQKKAGFFYKIVPWPAFLLGLTASILSGTRGAWIAIPILLLIVAIQYFHALRLRTWLAVAVGTFLIAIALYQSPQTRIAERFIQIYQEVTAYSSGKVQEGSASERLEGWRAAWAIFCQNPVLGAGPGSFKVLSHQMIDRGERSEIIRIYHQPHSSYLSQMSDCGVPGLVCLLAIFLVPGYVFKERIRHLPQTRDACFAGFYLIAAFMQYALTETIFGQNLYIGFYVVMTAAILTVGPKEATEIEKTKRVSAHKANL